MAFSFGDGFDLYATASDAVNGYWDSGTNIGNASSLSTGRFAGSRALQQGGGGVYLVKSSGSNDAVHHITVAYQQTGTLSGTTLWYYLQLLDGTTGQCCICFRSDGTIQLVSGTPAGTVLATYTNAAPVSSTWYAFEFEVVINNSTGSFTVRRNGNTTADFTATGLNTRGGTSNNYANKLTVGMNTGGGTGQNIDDLFWRSDASSVAWLGDIRCQTRMPANDVGTVQFTRVPAAISQTPFANNSSNTFTANQGRYQPFVPSVTGTIGTVTLPVAVASTANIKCSIYSSRTGGLPATSLGSATPVAAPPIGTATFTFGTPVSVTAGTTYFVAFCADATSGQCGANSATSAASGFWPSDTYASFPTTNPSVTLSVAPHAPTIILTPAATANFLAVNEAQQDTTTSYVYDGTVNDADFYSVGTIASVPVSTIAVTTRGYMQKSDAGSRTAAVQIKSGSTTVASPTLTLTTSGWQWTWRTDLVDPNTSAAWTAAAVDAVNVGPKVVS